VARRPSLSELGVTADAVKAAFDSVRPASDSKGKGKGKGKGKCKGGTATDTAGTYPTTGMAGTYPTAG
jgi:hypothetical protein